MKCFFLSVIVSISLTSAEENKELMNMAPSEDAVKWTDEGVIKDKVKKAKKAKK